MIRVDDRIKALFARQGVRRNFRVIFLDGWRADLTGTDVIQESVVLTEHVCSETVFRFGCCERSMIEFEAVGIESIQGAKIRCGLEIDISSLSAQDITIIANLIASNLRDGEVVTAEQSDLGWPYYRLPYGVYWVESCPRNHSNRNRRRVTAYSADPTKISEVERVRLSTFVPGPETFTASPYNLAAANLGWLLPDIYSAWGFHEDRGSNFNYYTWSDIQGRGATDSVSYSVQADGHTYEVGISGTYAVMDWTERMAGRGETRLARLSMSGWDSTAAWEYFVGLFSAAGVAAPEVPAHTRLPRTWLQPHIGNDKQDQYGSYDHAPVYWLPDDGCPFYIQRFLPQSLAANTFTRLMWDVTITFAVDGVQQSSQTFFPLAELSASIYQIYTQYTGAALDPAFNATNKFTGNSLDQYSFLNSYNAIETLAGPLEIKARQIRVDRAGLPQVIRLNNSSPTVIPASNVESAWWEDADISPVGAVAFRKKSFSPSGEDSYVSGTEYTGVDGKSIYNMLANSELLGTIFAGDGCFPIRDYFIPYLPAAEFIPYEGVIHELPWIQPGDAISLATGDPEAPSLASFVLTQTITGVQTIRQQISASGGSVNFDGSAKTAGVMAYYGKTESAGGLESPVLHAPEDYYTAEEVNTALNDYLTTRTFSTTLSSSNNVAHGSNAPVSISGVELGGYTCVGLLFATTSGPMSSWLFCYAMALSGTTATVWLRNTNANTDATTTTVSVTALFRKNMEV